jgi:carbonic anhydrase/acetyltransferase-like protein (isoleucine patch superfamily)
MTHKALIKGIGGKDPKVDAEAFVAPTSSVIGDVTLHAGASVWYGAVLRGDVERITVGASSNVQDNCTLHADPGFPVTVGERVSEEERQGVTLNGTMYADLAKAHGGIHD